MTDRISLLREGINKKAKISLEVYQIIQNTYRKMQGQPTELCRAQAMYNILTKIPIYIQDGDLLAGNGSSCQGGLEIDSANGLWNAWEIEQLRKDGYTFDEDCEEMLYHLNEEITPYGLNDGIAEILTEDSDIMPFLRSGMGMVRWQNLERGRQSNQCSAQGGLNLTPAQALVCLDYEQVMKKGLKVMIDECDECLAQIHIENETDYDRHIYTQSIKISLQGIVAYGRRMADLAYRMALKEKDETRKQELFTMYEICTRVPEYPARNFREALQMYWFIFLTVACPNYALGMGRLDQLLYPYYRHDIDAGAITDDEVLELLQILRIKDYQLGIVTGKDTRDDSNGEAKWHNIVIGGVDRMGKDATNELSYLFLEALEACPTLHPTLTIRVADSTPDKLILQGLKCVKKGLSMPAFVGDRSYIKYLLDNDVSIEDARDYVLTGCIDVNLPGKSRCLSACMFVTPMCLDVFLNKGINRNNGEQLGHDYGDLDQWTSYAAFKADFYKEFRYFITRMAEYCNYMIIAMQKYFPEPAKTAFMHDGIKEGIDYQKKQMPFENGGIICPVGLVNLGNSLMVIKKLVFDEKVITMTELKSALDADWKGYEALQKRCLGIAKYGNDEDEVDDIVAELYEYFDKVCNSLKSASGSFYRSSAVSIFGHAPGGALTGATPDGRRQGETLADAGASAMRGQDICGPLATIRSAIKLPQDRYQAVLFNMKLHPGTVDNDIDLRKLSAMIQTYFTYGGKHIQFNIVDAVTLQKAQENPDDYKDLMVRVAGYSAYYVQLTRRLQDEILERTLIETIS